MTLRTIVFTTTYPKYSANTQTICCVELVYCYIVHSITPLVLTNCSGAVTTQMDITVSDFFCTSSTPILASNITAGATGDIHGVLISVAAIGAFPDKFVALLHYLDVTTVPTLLAVVRFCIQLSIEDVVIVLLSRCPVSM